MNDVCIAQPVVTQEHHDFILKAHDKAQALTTLLSALVKLAEPGSAFHDLSTQCLRLARGLEADAERLNDEIG